MAPFGWKSGVRPHLVHNMLQAVRAHFVQQSVCVQHLPTVVKKTHVLFAIAACILRALIHIAPLPFLPIRLSYSARTVTSSCLATLGRLFFGGSVGLVLNTNPLACSRVAKTSWPLHPSVSYRYREPGPWPLPRRPPASYKSIRARAVRCRKSMRVME